MSHVTKGNVFEDLGFGRAEAADLAMKVDLAADLRKFFDQQKLTQEQAAEFFDVPRPKISQIRNNKLQGISIEYLVRMLAKTGGKLTYSFRQPSKQAAKARLREHSSATTN
jgi:predicted XRE-type DNA-binding protein